VLRVTYLTYVCVVLLVQLCDVLVKSARCFGRALQLRHFYLSLPVSLARSLHICNIRNDEQRVIFKVREVKPKCKQHTVSVGPVLCLSGLGHYSGLDRKQTPVSRVRSVDTWGNGSQQSVSVWPERETTLFWVIFAQWRRGYLISERRWRVKMSVQHHW
jgi:hypothetical protein